MPPRLDVDEAEKYICPRCNTAEYVVRIGQTFYCNRPTPDDPLGFTHCNYTFTENRGRRSDIKNPSE